jgi:hypothetical protein
MNAGPLRGRPLAESLDLVGEDLRELVVLAERVQGVISRLAAGGAPDPRTLVDAQAADLLSQRLAGLNSFVRALADAERGELTADLEAAVRDLTLAEQARRLSGALPAAAPEATAEAATFWD